MWIAILVLTSLAGTVGAEAQMAPTAPRCPERDPTRLLELGGVMCAPDGAGGLLVFAHSGKDEEERLLAIHAAANGCLDLATSSVLERLRAGDLAAVDDGIRLLGTIIGTPEAKAALAELFVLLDRHCEAEGGDPAWARFSERRQAVAGTRESVQPADPAGAEAYCGLRAHCLAALAGHRDKEVKRIVLTRLVRAEPTTAARINWYNHLHSAYQKDSDTIETLRALLSSEGSRLEADPLGKQFLLAIEEGIPVDPDR
jgi:hypothetical protein